ncbi:hypothetical protein amrb99_98050 [Actinomadura sp. RB99]|nr:hypothetical protein [Actinomadura sp. RB99]
MFVSEAIKQVGAGDRYGGYPSAAVASYVSGMKHVGQAEGRPGDLGAYRGTGHINVIAKNLGGGRYETIGGNEGPTVRRGVRGGQSAILRPMARGGLLDQRAEDLRAYKERNLDRGDRRSPLLQYMRHATYDQGGLLQPGWTMAFNGTGRAEAVTTLAKGGRLSSGSSGGATTSPAARRTAGSALLKQITDAMLSSTTKLAAYFTRLNSQIKKNFGGAAEKRLLAWSSAIQKAMSAAASRAASIAPQIAAAKEYAKTVTSSAREFASLSGLSNKGSAANIASGLGDRASTLTTFASQITQLSKRGLSKDLLRQIVDMGAADGGSIAATLLAGNSSTIAEMNRNQAAINKAAGKLGNTAADALYDSGKGAGRGFLTGLYDQKAALDTEMDRLGKRLADGVRRTFGVPTPKSRKPSYLKPAALSFDDGGMLQPGYTLVHNGLGRPEPVGEQQVTAMAAAALGGASGGPLVGELHLHGVDGYRVPQDVMRGIRQAERAARSRRRR